MFKNELIKNNVSEIDDILNDYEEHFKFKLEEGKTEEEISNNLGNPKNIAREFENNNVQVNKYEKGTKRFYISMLSIPSFLVYILMWLSVIAVFALAVSSFALGFCLITRINIFNLIPYIPYFSAFITALSYFALSIISSIATFYMALYIKHWGKIYVRWSSNYINGGHYLSISKQPSLSKKISFTLKLILVISTIVFFTMFTLGYFSMALSAGNLEFWHVWGWFV